MLSRRQFFQLSAGFGAFGASSTAYGFAEPVVRLCVTSYDIQSPQWPSGFELKIAAVADVHACDPWMSLRISKRSSRTPTRSTRTSSSCSAIMLPGITHVTRFIPADEWAPVLAGLKAPLGVHAILGNHDYWSDEAVQRDGKGVTVARRALEAAGVPVYENDAVRLTKVDRPFWLAGLGDQLAYAPARRFRPASARRRR